ncbi:ap-2 complex subunit mu [Anaeramoeba ignava]|uniref:Ap-2 complex subunit mu n=1 Tax=Anaeramoeba ignava TaxID=1746090 RepID=A0A9Q0R9Q2_ANAIG|nr:ap-2 complex subunit mu [Anaeramoeba ignava]
MISAITFINEKGSILISRMYREDIPKNFAESFRIEVIAAKEIGCPIKQMEDTIFMFQRISNIFIVAVTKKNVNAALVFEFLKTLVSVLESYFGSVNENSIRNNFSLIYEILDETIDFGYPQNSSTDILKLYINQENFRQDKDSAETAKKIAIKATGVIGWRKDDIFYPRNELFLDVIESVNLLMSNSGNVLKSDVAGVIVMKSQLSGMPECKLGLNDKVAIEEQTTKTSKARDSAIALDDCTFHQCVKLGKFDSDRTISFIPPDGVFELMKYRTTENVMLPFKVMPVVKEQGGSTVEAKVTIRAEFSEKLFASKVVIRIPVPKNTADTKTSTTIGRAKYDPTAEAIVWRIKRFPGRTESSINAEINLIRGVDSNKTWSRPPISMDFQVPMYTSSGLRVRFLKVFEKSNYEAVKWVRYITKAGSYQIRI